MQDILQTSLHLWAVQSSLVSALAVFAASYLLFLMVMGFAGIGLVHLKKITWGLLLRATLGLVLAVLFTEVLVRLVVDVRPYIAEHYVPLAHVSTDNGFPSDHTLVAALLTGFLLWIDRRWFVAFAILTLIVGLGRLAIGAHHSLDIAGSLLIAMVSVALAGSIPLEAPIFQRQVVPSKSV